MYLLKKYHQVISSASYPSLPKQPYLTRGRWGGGGSHRVRTNVPKVWTSVSRIWSPPRVWSGVPRIWSSNSRIGAIAIFALAVGLYFLGYTRFRRKSKKRVSLCIRVKKYNLFNKILCSSSKNSKLTLHVKKCKWDRSFEKEVCRSFNLLYFILIWIQINETANVYNYK